MGSRRRTIVVMHTGGDAYIAMSKSLVEAFRAQGVLADILQVPPAIFLESKVAAHAKGDPAQLRKMFHDGLKQAGVTDTFIVNRARSDLPIPEGVAHHCWVQDPYVAPVERGFVGEHQWMYAGQWTEWWGGKTLLPASDFGAHLTQTPEVVADVAFAGFLPNPFVEASDPGFDQMTPQARSAVAQALNIACSAILEELDAAQTFISDRHYAESILERAGKRVGQSLQGPLYDTLLWRTRSHLVRYVQRKRLMDFVIPLCLRRGWRLRIAGTGWERLAAAKPHQVGQVAPGPALARFYQSAKVNLQVNGDYNVHPRLMEGLACGSFVLSEACPTDDQPHGLRSILDADAAPTYRNFDELESLLERYIENDALRQEAVRRGGAIVREQHNYHVRAAQILAG